MDVILECGPKCMRMCNHDQQKMVQLILTNYTKYLPKFSNEQLIKAAYFVHSRIHKLKDAVFKDVMNFSAGLISFRIQFFLSRNSSEESFGGGLIFLQEVPKGVKLQLLRNSMYYLHIESILSPDHAYYTQIVI